MEVPKTPIKRSRAHTVVERSDSARYFNLEQLEGASLDEWEEAHFGLPDQRDIVSEEEDLEVNWFEEKFDQFWDDQKVLVSGGIGEASAEQRRHAPGISKSNIPLFNCGVLFS